MANVYLTTKSHWNYDDAYNRYTVDDPVELHLWFADRDQRNGDVVWDYSVRVVLHFGSDPIHTLNMHDDRVTVASVLGEDVIAGVGHDRIVVKWECGTRKMIDKTKIRYCDHRQAVITGVWVKLAVWMSEGELDIIEYKVNRGLRYNSRIKRAHRRRIQT